jgi:probable rRNA maturation factor
MQVQFFFLASNINLRDRTRLKRYIVSIFQKHKRKLGHLNYIFCSDEYLLQMNRTHLKHEYYTDIITFDLSVSEEAIEGEVYISTDRVRDNATLLENTITKELHRVIFHGALHLCGYKDKRPQDIKQMRQAEDDCLDEYFNT